MNPSIGALINSNPWNQMASDGGGDGSDMAPKKVALAWISNDTTRRATLKKRRKGLMKKVKELSILCDVRACAVVYSPHEPQPEVWRSVAEATRVLSGFRSMPETEQSKKMMNQETFLRHRVAKLHDQLLRNERENRELQSAALLRETLAGGSLAGLRIEELGALAWLLEVKSKAVQDRIDRLRAAESVKPAALQLSSGVRDQKLGLYYHEALRWFAGGDHTAMAGGNNYQMMSASMAAAAFAEQNQNRWENFFPYF